MQTRSGHVDAYVGQHTCI